VAISHTGSTTETLAVTRAAAEAGATTAALTSFLDSPLTGLVDHLLVAGSRETSYRIEAMTSRLLHLAVLDALYVAVVLRSPAAREALRATGDVLVEHRI
jgi:DNA-binding MurR/RpiR family transcriptional regulator